MNTYLIHYPEQTIETNASTLEEAKQIALFENCAVYDVITLNKMKKYQVHFPDQTVSVEANTETQAEDVAQSECECDSITEVI
jgi:hypothetical protein